LQANSKFHSSKSADRASDLPLYLFHGSSEANARLGRAGPQTNQAVEKLGFGVILSEAKNLSSI
jgi:hypothetical protein